MVLLRNLLRIQPNVVTSGEPVIVSIDVQNTGELRGAVIIPLLVDGVLIEELEISVNPGTTETLVFAPVVALDSGLYTIGVDGITGEFTVTEPGGGGILIILIIAIVALLVVGGGGFVYFKVIRS